MELEFDVLYYFVNIVVALEMTYAYCRVLHLRSNALFAFIQVAGTNLSFLLLHLQWPSVERFFLISIPMYVIFPIALARDPWGKRLLWTMVVPMVFVITDAAGTLCYYMLTGALIYDTITDANAPAVLMTYVVLMFVAGISSIGVAAIHDRIKSKVGGAGGLPAIPIVALLFWSHVLTVIAYAGWAAYGKIDVFPSPAFVIPSIAVLDVALSFAALLFVQTETRARRMQADAAAQVRQTKHMRNEILVSTQQSVALKRLRHDLATQMHAIPAMQQNGQEGMALERLNALQHQAQEITR